MLGNVVYTRRDGEKIRIGPDITITVVWSEHGKTKLAIQAPKEIAVDREEIAIAKQRATPTPSRDSYVPGRGARQTA